MKFPHIDLVRCPHCGEKDYRTLERHPKPWKIERSSVSPGLRYYHLCSKAWVPQVNRNLHCLKCFQKLFLNEEWVMIKSTHTANEFMKKCRYCSNEFPSYTKNSSSFGRKYFLNWRCFSYNIGKRRNTAISFYLDTCTECKNQKIKYLNLKHKGFTWRELRNLRINSVYVGKWKS